MRCKFECRNKIQRDGIDMMMKCWIAMGLSHRMGFFSIGSHFCCLLSKVNLLSDVLPWHCCFYFLFQCTYVFVLEHTRLWIVQYTLMNIILSNKVFTLAAESPDTQITVYHEHANFALTTTKKEGKNEPTQTQLKMKIEKKNCNFAFFL